MTASGSRITIGIVSYCTRDLLEVCLTGLLTHSGPVMVFDNGSDDGSVEMVRNRFPSVRLRASGRNVGYSKAANQLLVDTTTPYLLLMNADARPLPGAVDGLEQALDTSPSAAVIGPRLIDQDGALQRSCRSFPTLGSFFVDQSGLRMVFDRLEIGDRYRRFDHNSDHIVPWVLGAVLALRIDPVLEIGGFDSEFFLYFEEIDLSRRLLQAGWETRFTADAVFAHVGGASSAGSSIEADKVFYRSGARYFGIHAPHSAGRYPAVALAGLGLSWLAALVRHRRNDWPLVRAVAADRSAWHTSEVMGG